MATSAYAHQQLEADLMAVGEQTLTVLPMIQAFSREGEADRRFGQVSYRTLKAYLRSILTQFQFKVGVTGVTTLGTATMMVLGGLEVAQGQLSLGSLLVFLSYLNALYAPIETLAYLSSGVAGAAAGGQRVLEVLDQPVGVYPAAHARRLDPALVRGEIRLDQVTFGYRPGEPVLQQVSLTIQAGETLALVGPTGAGKSSLVALLPRFYDPWQGRILLDGEDIRGLEIPSLRFANFPGTPGSLPAAPLDLGQYYLWLSWSQPGGGVGCRPGSPGRWLYSPASPGLRYGAGGRGSHPLRGPEAAPGDCPSPGEKGPHLNSG
jgi:ATP-binding cassette subfamily B protein/subfamily B ATP-binding cassette protein MsbA